MHNNRFCTEKNKVSVKLLKQTSTFCFSAFMTFSSGFGFAADLVVDTNASLANQSQLSTTLNGTSVQNIATPNATGLSHNMFETFNVNTQGLVINNSSADVISNIGGAVLGNANLVGGAASVILNEVTSANRSVLSGPQELVGTRADYILANPNGITCNGCGFINFPRATLTTGTPLLNGGGLTGFDVNAGDILIEGLGLNATQADFFDIISRSIVINAALNAKDLNLIAGRNTVDYASRLATAKANDGSTKPTFAIDSSILGGMYANRISLVGTEAGVGVRLAGNMATSVDDISLNVNGKISFNANQVSAARDIVITSNQVAATAGNEIELNGSTLYANRNVSITGGDTALTGGRTGAGNNITIAANSYSDTGTGQRDAVNAFTLGVTGNATVNGSTLLSNNTMTVNANSLSMQNSAKILAESTLSVTTPTLTQQSGTVLSSNGVTSVNTTSVDNTGYIGGTTQLTVSANNITNRSGGVLSSQGTLTLSNNGASGTSLQTFVGSEIKGGSLNINYLTINNAGTMYGQTSATLSSNNFTNSGLMSTSGSLTLNQLASGGSLSNTNNIEANILSLSIDNLTNSGTIYGATLAALNSRVVTNNSGGKIASDGTLTMNSNATRGVWLVNNLGAVIAANSLNLYFNTVDNYDKLYGGASLTIGTGILSNYGGIHSNGGMTLSATNLNNIGSATYAADIVARDQLLINNNYQLNNASPYGLKPRIMSTMGNLIIDSTLSGAGQYVRNNGGFMYGSTGVSITVSNEFSNSNGAELFSYDGNLNINTNTAGYVNNIDSSIENYLGNINIIAGSFYNTTGTAAGFNRFGTTNTNLNSTFFDGTNYINVDGANCGTNADPGFVLGDSCVRSTDIVYDELVTGTDASPRSRLIAGGDINITVQTLARNYISIISAGNNLTVNGAAGSVFENEALMLTRKESATVYTDADGGNIVALVLASWALFTDYCNSGGLVLSPVPGTTQCFWIGTDEHQKGWNSQLRSNITTSVGVGSTVEAGGTITINTPGGVTNNNGKDIQLGAGEGGAARIYSPSAMSTTDPVTGGTITLDVNTQGSGITPTTINSALSGTTSITLSTFDLSPLLLSSITALASSPFFVASTDPTATFIFETDPNLISLAGLYSSDFFLSSIGLNPDDYFRLGDAYYEQQLLRQQLLAEAGQRFIVDGLANENEQYKYLLENAVLAKESLQLRLGIALTADQINGLEKDIVWMVEAEVNGKKVLVPQLFLSNATRAKLADGAKFVASDIKIKTEGPVTNSGAFVASNDLDIDSGSSFTNRLGTLSAGNNIDITARDDIRNESGRISGGNVSLNSTEGSVQNITLTRDKTVVGAFGEGTNTEVGDIATIEARNNLSIDAANDIVSEGGQVNAGNNALLNAGNDITFSTIDVKRYSESSENIITPGNSILESESTSIQTSIQLNGKLGSGLNVGGNLTSNSGNDTNIIGSDINVLGSGNIKTGGDLNVLAAIETTTVNTTTTETSTFDSSGQTGDPDKDGAKGVNASGEVTLISQTVTTSNTTAESARGSSLNFGGNLNVQSDNDINITGSDILVAGNGSLDAANDVNILAAQEQTTVTTESETNSFSMQGSANLDGASGGMSYSNEKTTGGIDQTLNRTSSITFGGNVNISAGNDVTEQGTDFYAGGDTTINAGRDFNSVAAVDTYHETGTTKGVSVGISAGVEVGLGGIAEGFSKPNGANIATTASDVIGKVKDMTGSVGASASLSVDYNESTTTTDTTTSKVSTFGGGGNLNISAGRDANLQGTEASVEGDINLSAGNDVNITAAQDTETTTVTTLDVSAEVSVDAGGGGSLSGSGGNSTTTETTTTAKVAKLGAGGNLNITAGNNVGLEGTELSAGGDASIEATNGSVDFKAAKDTYFYSKDSTEASAGIEASKTGGGVSGGYAGGKETINASTATAGSITANNLTIKAKQDVSLEGTNLAAANSASIEATEGNIDFKAARDTYDKSSNSTSVDVSLEASKQGGGGSFELGLGKVEDHSNTATGGSITASNLTLKSGGDTRLEGTQVDVSDSASIETGGKLVLESAVSTARSSSSNTDISLSLEMEKGKGANGKQTVKDGGGSASFGFQADSESANSTTNQNATLNIGGKLSVKTGGDLELKGVDIKPGQLEQQVGGKIVVEERKDSSSSSKSSAGFAIAAIVPDKKTRNKINQLKTKTGIKNAKADLNATVKNKVAGLKNTLNNKTDAIKTTVKNKVAAVKTTGSNAVGSIKTTGKNIGADKNTRTANNQANKTKKEANNTTLANKVKTNTEAKGNRELANNIKLTKTTRENKNKATDKKLANNTRSADSKDRKNEINIAKQQEIKDQKAENVRQKNDDKATIERDQKLAALDADTSLSDADRKQKIDDIKYEYVTTTKTNAEKLAETKKANAKNTETTRKTYVEKTAQRKLDAENKALDSKLKHSDKFTKTINGLAKNVRNPDDLKKDAADANARTVKEVSKLRVDKSADITAAKDKAIADKEITLKRQESDINAEQAANEKKLAIETSKSDEVKKIDADASLSDAEKSKKKQEIVTKAELAKVDVELDLAKTKKENEKQSQLEQVVANSKAEQNKNNTKTTFVKTRDIADSRAVRDLKLADATKTLDEDKTKVDTDHAAALTKASDRHEKNVKKAERDRNKKRNKAKQDRQAADDTAKSDFDSKKQALENDTSLSDSERTTKLSSLQTDFDKAKNANKAKELSERKEARKEQEKSIELANKAKLKRIKAADKDKTQKLAEAQQAFTAKKDKLQSEHIANKRVASGQNKKQDKLDAAKIARDEAERDALATKTEKDRDVRNDTSLSDEEKSLKLKNNSIALTNSRNAAKRTFLAEQKKQADLQDSRERNQEKTKLTNSDLSDAEKKTKKKEIEKKYKDLKTTRQAEFDTELNAIKDESAPTKVSSNTGAVQAKKETKSKPATAITIGQRAKPDSNKTDNNKPERRGVTIGQRGNNADKTVSLEKTQVEKTSVSKPVATLPARGRSNSDATQTSKNANVRPRSSSEGTKPDNTTPVAKSDTDSLVLAKPANVISPVRGRSNSDVSSNTTTTNKTVVRPRSGSEGGQPANTTVLAKVDTAALQLLKQKKDIEALNDIASDEKIKMRKVLENIIAGRDENGTSLNTQSGKNRPLDRMPERVKQVADMYDGVLTSTQNRVKKEALNKRIKTLEASTQNDITRLKDDMDRDLKSAADELKTQTLLMTALPDINVPGNKDAAKTMSEIATRADKISKLETIKANIKEKSNDSNLKPEETHSELEKLQAEKSELKHELEVNQLENDEALLGGRIDMAGKLIGAAAAPRPSIQPGMTIPTVIPKGKVIGASSNYNAELQKIKVSFVLEKSAMNDRGTKLNELKNLKAKRDTELSNIKKDADSNISDTKADIEYRKAELTRIEKVVDDELRAEAKNDESKEDEYRLFYKKYRDGNHTLDQLEKLKNDIAKTSSGANDRALDKTNEINNKYEKKINAPGLSDKEVSELIKQKNVEIDAVVNSNNDLNHRDDVRIRLLEQTIKYRTKQQDIDLSKLKQIEIRNNRDNQIKQVSEDMRGDIVSLEKNINELDSDITRLKLERQNKVIDAEIKFLGDVVPETKNPDILIKKIVELQKKKAEINTQKESQPELEVDTGFEIEKEKLDAMKNTLAKKEVHQARDILKFMSTSETAKRANNVSELPLEIKQKMADSIGLYDDMDIVERRDMHNTPKELDARLESILKKGAGKILKTINNYGLAEDSVPDQSRNRFDADERRRVINNIEKQHTTFSDQVKAKTQ